MDSTCIINCYDCFEVSCIFSTTNEVVLSLPPNLHYLDRSRLELTKAGKMLHSDISQNVWEDEPCTFSMRFFQDQKHFWWTCSTYFPKFLKDTTMQWLHMLRVWLRKKPIALVTAWETWYRQGYMAYKGLQRPRDRRQQTKKLSEEQKGVVETNSVM